MPRRTPETLADYLVVAICPALIMLLVGSLLFFLVEVLYQGEFELRLLFVLAMFVMGIVCLARLSMEESHAYASMYAVPLGVLVGIALVRFVRFGGPLAPYSLLVIWGLMAWTWWCAHKLTWDCTLIDDSQDASGEGLLQQMGLDNEADGAATGNGPEATTAPPETATAVQPESANKEWWLKWIEPDRRPHPPGVWVVYFSLGALPMFGLGGRFIAVENLDSRRWCFWMLVLYVASAMALLLATSFLGLRKYLRQRRLEMPLEMAAVWVGAGLMLIVATIVVAAMLPRPSPEYSIAQMIKIDSPERWASRWGVGPEGGKSKPDNPSSSGAEQQKGQEADQQGGGKADPENKSGETRPGDKGQGQGRGKGKQSQQSQSKSDSSQSSSSQQSQDKNNSSSSRGAKSNQSNQSSQEQQQQRTDQTDTGPKSDTTKQDNSSQKSNQSQQGDQQGSQQQDQRSPDQQSSGSSSDNSGSQTPQIMRYVQTAIGAIGGLLKAAFYLALAIVAFVLAWRYRAELAAAWKKLLAELAALWPSLFGKKQEAAAAPEMNAPAPPRPFAQFTNPFASGQAARMSPAEVVRYTFAALEAWGRENGCPRAIGQTPHEYAAEIGELDRTLSCEAGQLADLYARMAYAPPAAIRTSFEPLRALWRKMSSPAVEVVGV